MSTETAVNPAASSRRAWLVATAAAAGAAGAGVAWWRLQPHGEADVSAFWQQQFTAPDGAPITLAAFRGRPLLVNFWATWCPPCIEELPLLNSFYREQRTNGWQLLGIAVDRIEAVKPFLARQPLDFPIAMAGIAGVEVSRALGNAAGGLPFTVLFDRQGSAVQRKIGQVRPADLQAWAKPGAMG